MTTKGAKKARRNPGISAVLKIANTRASRKAGVRDLL